MEDRWQSVLCDGKYVKWMEEKIMSGMGAGMD